MAKADRSTSLKSKNSKAIWLLVSADIVAIVLVLIGSVLNWRQHINPPMA